MFRRLTSRRVLKWAGTIACALIATTFVATAWVPLDGGFYVGSKTEVVWNLGGGFVSISKSSMQPGIFVAYPHGLHIAQPQRITWWPTRFVDGSSGPPFNMLIVNIPLWLALLVFLLPTLLLWRLDRRPPLPGHCGKCGYDLTGNVSGRCPECGSEIVAGATRAAQATRRGAGAVSANEPGGGNAAGV